MGSLAFHVAGVATQVGPDAGELPFSDATIAILGGAVILFLLGLSAFFSSSEIAMFSLPPHRIDSMVADKLPNAELLKSLKDDPHRLLVTILVREQHRQHRDVVDSDGAAVVLLLAVGRRPHSDVRYHRAGVAVRRERAEVLHFLMSR